jgi:hypothetical protein
MAAVDQALEEFGKIDILINCESLLIKTRGCWCYLEAPEFWSWGRDVPESLGDYSRLGYNPSIYLKQPSI